MFSLPHLVLGSAGKHHQPYPPKMKASSAPFFLFCILVLAHQPTQSHATTIVASGATINTNTQWLLADSPYVLQGGLTISLGSALTIEAGVEVYVADNQGINVLGTLRALGQNLLPVCN